MTAPNLEVRKRMAPDSVGRCNSCHDPERDVSCIRIGDQVIRLCRECSKLLTSLLR